jgi:hypothetical protein
MEAYGGLEVSGQLYVAAALLPKNIPRYPSDSRRGGSQNGAELRGEGKIVVSTGT